MDKRLLEHVDGIYVEMVGRLVEAEERIGSDQDLRKRQASLLASGQDGDALVDVISMEEKRAEQAPLLRDGPSRRHLVYLRQHRVGGVERLELMLRVVGVRHVLPKADRPAIRPLEA